MMTPEKIPANQQVGDNVPDGTTMDVIDLENQSSIFDNTTDVVDAVDAPTTANLNNSVNASMTSENCKIIDESDTQLSPCPDPEGCTNPNDVNTVSVRSVGSGIMVPDSPNLTPVKLDSVGHLKEQDTFTSSPTYSRDGDHNLVSKRDDDEDMDEETVPMSRRQQRMRIIKCYGLVAIIILICAIGIPLGAVVLFKNQNEETSFSGVTATQADESTSIAVDDMKPSVQYKPDVDVEEYHTINESVEREEQATTVPEYAEEATDAPTEEATDVLEEEETDVLVVPEEATDVPVEEQLDNTMQADAVTQAPLVVNITNVEVMTTTDIATDAPAEIEVDSEVANVTEADAVGDERNVTSEAVDLSELVDVPDVTESPSEVADEGQEIEEDAMTDGPTVGKTATPTGRPSMSPSATATMRPTAPTTPGPDRSGVYFDLINVTSPAILQDTTSPQALSYLWLVEQDQLLPVPEGRKAIQRYILVVMDHVLHDPMLPLISSPVLDECQWTGVVCDPETGDVTQINWVRQGLNGKIAAPELKHLQTLVRLDLSENELVGTLDGIYEVTSLRELYLNSNQLTGTLSEQIGFLNKLEFLYLTHNGIEGQIPLSLRSPPGESRPLKWLSLAYNRITGYLPPDWRMRNLFYLDLGHNNLSGPLASDWNRNMVRLRHLYLDHNSFTGTIPSFYGTLGNGRLRQINLHDNFLSGEVPFGFSSKDLSTLNVHNNNITTPLDERICQMSIFEQGVMVEMRVDCPICTCDTLCHQCANPSVTNVEK